MPQKTLKQGSKDATFDYDSPNRVGAKLGLPDITALITAIRCRWARLQLPEAIQAKDRAANALRPDTVGIFHKFEKDGVKSTTSIEYQLVKDGAYLSMSKSATQRQRMKLTITEEIQLEAALLHALQMFQRTGKR